MIDLHSHILPGIDDGPKDEIESLALAIKYQEAGFSKIVATPHAIPGTAWMPSIEEVREKIHVLNNCLVDNGINIKLYSGMEIALDSAVPDLLDNHRILPLAHGPYLLIEMPFQQRPLGWEQIFFNVLAKGYHIVMAHPERCEHLIRNPALFDTIIDMGIFLQVNYDSFLGVYGRAEADTAFSLVHKGHAHCLASDSHDAANRSPEHVHKVIRILKNCIGSENTDIITCKNPARIINGQPLLVPEPVENSRRKKSWQVNWKRWLSG